VSPLIELEARHALPLSPLGGGFVAVSVASGDTVSYADDRDQTINTGTLTLGAAALFFRAPVWLRSQSASVLRADFTPGETGTAVDYGPAYAPARKLLVAPLDPLSMNVGSSPTANNILACRVVVPASGILRDFAVYIAVTSGNVRGGVYDTTATRTLLWDSGSVPAGAANAWQVLGSPGLVVAAGQELDFAIIVDNATVTIGRFTAFAANPNAFLLPANFILVGGGAAPRLIWQYSPGSFALAASIPEASLQGITGGPVLIARVS
jgi:hypothetical protein